MAARQLFAKKINAFRPIRYLQAVRLRKFCSEPVVKRTHVSEFPNVQTVAEKPEHKLGSLQEFTQNMTADDHIRIACTRPLNKVDYWRERLEKTWVAMLVVGLIGAAAINIRYTMNSMEGNLVMTKQAESVGIAQIGLEPWEMIDQDGNPVYSTDLLGKYTLIYFGFSFCPDVCPAELNKMSKAIEILESRNIQIPGAIVPIFVSVDPRRDSPEVIKKYCEQFHPKIVGLTGTVKQLAHFAHVMKTYFSQPPDLGTDYILEHSTYMYFTDRKGNYVDITKSEHNAENVADLVCKWIYKNDRALNPERSWIKELTQRWKN